MENNKSFLTLRDIWEILLANIWLFIVSLVISVSIAVYYIVVTPPTYSSMASIMIKSDKNGNSLGDSPVFDNMGLVNMNTDINNEIYTLSNPTLMEEVVRRLSLDCEYKLKYRDLRWVDMYNNTPFRVDIDSAMVASRFSFHFTTDGNDSFELSELIVGGKEIDGVIKDKFSNSFQLGEGKITIEKRGFIPSDVKDNLYSFSKVSQEDAVSKYVGALKVELKSKDASIINLSIMLGSIQKAADILNTLISVYNENWIIDKNRITLSTTNFINERLAIIEQELGEVDRNISNYKSENLLPNIGAVTGMNLQSSNEILKQQIALNNQLSMAKYVLEYIESDIENNRQITINSGIESSSINEQIRAYNELLLNKNSLLANSSINNPVIADMIVDLNVIKKGLISSINDLISTIQLEISYNKQEETVTRKKLSNNPNQELYLQSTGREQKIKEELYLFLLQKREENELNQAFTAYNTKVMNMARGSSYPIAPQRNQILLLSLVIGVVLPILFLIVKSNMNVTVEDKGDLSNITIPFLGVIPVIKSKRRLFNRKIDKKEQIIISSGGRDILSESLRIVRTNLDFVASVKDECKVINITSFHPKSGKSFISINLALSLASKASKILVVDTDFRRGSLSTIASSPKKGIVNYLNGMVDDINDVIVKGGLSDNLDILPMGVTPPNPTELLLTDRFEQLVLELKNRYDYIIFDCPPVELVSDAKIVEKNCNTTLFIIRAGLMDKRDLPSLQQIYDEKRVKSMGLVLNGVDYHKNSKYGYGRYGGYGYGKYGYGGYGDQK
ncbi:MAG: polysaccharide biosynthesis tyrosine autokinase [Rikenellaceae bacterium]